MLVDFDKSFKQEPDEEQLNRVFRKLIQEKNCAMCKNAEAEEDYEHGYYKTYNTICGLTGLLRNGKNGRDCPYWEPVKDSRNEDNTSAR